VHGVYSGGGNICRGGLSPQIRAVVQPRCKSSRFEPSISTALFNVDSSLSDAVKPAASVAGPRGVTHPKPWDSLR